MFWEKQIGCLFIKWWTGKEGGWAEAPLRDRLIVGWDDGEKTRYLWRSKWWGK